MSHEAPLAKFSSYTTTDTENRDQERMEKEGPLTIPTPGRLNFGACRNHLHYTTKPSPGQVRY
jgi:hypothetical protein